MKHHVAFKFLAVFLCACCLLVSVTSLSGIVFMARIGLYDQTVEDIQFETAESSLYTLSNRIAQLYAATNLGGCSEELLEHYYADTNFSDTLSKGLWFYTLADDNGTILVSTYSGQTGVTTHRLEVSPVYPEVIFYGTSSTHVPDVTAPTQLPATPPATATTPEGPADDPTVQPPFSYLNKETFGWYDKEAHLQHIYHLGFLESPDYTVTLYLLPDAYTNSDAAQWQFLDFLWEQRYPLFLYLAVSLMLFAIFTVYLCATAGHSPGSSTLRPGGLNALPLDLYFVAVVLAIWGTSVADHYLVSWVLGDTFQLASILGALFLTFGTCLLAVGFICAIAAQAKVAPGHWRENAIFGRLFQALRRWALKLTRAAGRFLGVLPVIWRWLLLAALLGLLSLLALHLHNTPLLLLSLGVTVGLLAYGGYCFGSLLKAASRMGSGDLNAHVDDRPLLGSFRAFAHHLNSLAGVATSAAQKQMKSERMKAELITNVSHDIKTPLTSIVNYVDLLQKSPSPQESQEYLQVLARQSQRLKKLIEDLMEMSKANTGNIPVDITTLDANEAINQALGEFSDKLLEAQLTPVFTQPAKAVPMRCDGRLTWRVLSNLLSNAVKYAMPGTRLYIDLTELSDHVLISLKNISREPLNISSDELMERFVRGDASRNTEGSGLGLNIAKSLMELQQGSLQLLVDGDLFKATLIFPR